MGCRSLHAQLGAPPVPPLGVVPDRVVGPEADPRGHRPVLLGLLRQRLLGLHALVGRLWREERDVGYVRRGWRAAGSAGLWVAEGVVLWLSDEGATMVMREPGPLNKKVK